MAVADKESALSRVATDPVSRRKLLAVTGGSTALAAFLAACGSDSDTTTMATSSAAAKTGTEKFGKGDVGILNYALTLEYLETAFYADVVKSGLFKGSDLATIRKFGSEEAEHVTALTAFVKKLGGKPAPKPKTEFPLKNAKSVLELAGTVENLGAAAYLGQAANIKSLKCSPPRSRSTASRDVMRRRSTRCSVSRSRRTAPLPFRPAPTKSSSPSNPSSSAEPTPIAKGERDERDLDFCNASAREYRVKFSRSSPMCTSRPIAKTSPAAR